MCACKNKNNQNNNKMFITPKTSDNNTVVNNPLLLKENLSVEDLRKEFQKRFMAGTKKIKK